MRNFCQLTPTSLRIIFMFCFGLSLSSCSHRAKAEELPASEPEEELNSVLDSEDEPMIAETEAVTAGPQETYASPYIPTKPETPSQSPTLSKEKAAAPSKRATTSTPSKGTFLTTLRSCDAFESAAETSRKIKSIATGKRIWVEQSDTAWYKIFLKNSSAFLQSDCLGK